MKKALVVGMLGLAAGACGGPDVEYWCEQSLKCSESQGVDFGSLGLDFQGLCEDSAESQLDDTCKSSEVDAIDEAIEDCKSKKSCDFVTCVGTKEPEATQCLIPESANIGSQCGDDFADATEDCDGTDLWNEDCSTQTGGTKPGGTLKCTAQCTFDTSGCM